MSRRVPRGLALPSVLLIGLTLLAACGPRVSDTAFTGAWRRVHGMGETTISLWEEGGEYRFLARRESDVAAVRCERSGVCTEYSGDTPIYEWRYRVSRLDDPAGLRVAVEGTPLDGVSTPLGYVDRLDLKAGGLELWSTMIELNGEPVRVKSGVRRFAKLADDPFY
jgi:hypothetical protein